MHRVESVDVYPPRDTHHRVLGRLQAHDDAPERATMIRFEQVMRERGTDFGTMLARQPWTKPFGYELLDAFIRHQLSDKRHVTSFRRAKS